MNNYMKHIEQMTRAEAIDAIKSLTSEGHDDLALRVFLEKRISRKVYRAAVQIGEEQKKQRNIKQKVSSESIKFQMLGVKHDRSM